MSESGILDTEVHFQYGSIDRVNSDSIYGELEYLLVLFGLYSLLQKPKGLRGFAAVVYAFMLLLINFVCITAVFTWIFYRDSQESSIIPLVVTAAGNIVFLISDSILAFTMFKKDFKYSKFFVQLTYIAAQFLLVTGILSGI